MENLIAAQETVGRYKTISNLHIYLKLSPFYLPVFHIYIFVLLLLVEVEGLSDGEGEEGGQYPGPQHLVRPHGHCNIDDDDDGDSDSVMVERGWNVFLLIPD